MDVTLDLVLNRADSSLGIRVTDVENSIGRKVDHTIVSDGRSVVYASYRDEQWDLYSVTIDGLTLTVETTDGRRVGKVLAVRVRGAGELDGEQDGDR